jgi:hypothetical protein
VAAEPVIGWPDLFTRTGRDEILKRAGAVIDVSGQREAVGQPGNCLGTDTGEEIAGAKAVAAAMPELIAGLKAAGAEIQKNTAHQVLVAERMRQLVAILTEMRDEMRGMRKALDDAE